MKQQTGYIFRSRGSWYGRWRRDELKTAADGSKTVVRCQHAEKLCDYGDRYRSKRDVQPLLNAKLQHINEGRSRPESTLTVAAYGQDYFLPYAKKELKPSTSHGYQGIWRMYLKPRLADIELRDFRCVDATKTLAAIHREHGLSRKSLRNCKALLSSIFTKAKQDGVLDGYNPVTDAGIPRAAVKSKPTHAYSPEEVFAMLDVFDGVARTAIALLYFCGLRPGEARAARWENYDGKTLHVRESMWRTHTTQPKTEDSVGCVPVAETLRDILAETRRESGLILAPSTRCGVCHKEKHEPSGHEYSPASGVDLHNLAARVVIPRLARCAECDKEKKEHKANGHQFKPLPKWHGWYGFRRGLATLATKLGQDGSSQLAAKSLLRHSNIQTTQAYYIKSVPADAVRAVEMMDALFHKSANVAHT